MGAARALAEPGPGSAWASSRRAEKGALSAWDTCSTMSAPETLDTPMTAARPRPGELTFSAPRRAKPPRHLADLTLAERKAALTELGHQGFRAAQISKHYFGHLAEDPGEWTDVPAAAREELAEVLTPRLLTPVKEQTADGGTTRKTLWR